jgi:hypothetical protein
VVKKRGAHITHRAKSAPGIVAISIGLEFETHLRTSVLAFRAGYATRHHYLDLCDTHDLMRIAIEARSLHEPSTLAVLDLVAVALENIADRFQERGKFGASGEEYAALQLLADTCLHFWSRHSGALFRHAYVELRRLRIEEQTQIKAQAIAKALGHAA